MTRPCAPPISQPSALAPWHTAAVSSRTPAPPAETGQATQTAYQHLIVQLRYGQPDALAALFGAYSGVTYRVCLRMLTTPEDAEEVLHDTFLRLEAQAGRYDPARGTVQTFILTIAHHLCLERLRARRARPQGQEWTDDTPEPRSPYPARDPLDQALLRAALDGLPDTDRLLLEAMFFDGYTHAELTARTGLPLGTVKSRLRRALLRLREKVTP